MKLDCALKSAQPPRLWIPYFVLVGTLLLTAIATYYVAIAAKERDRLRFDNAVQRTQDDIQNRLDTYIAMLRSGSGLFAANDQVSRQQFRAYVDRLDLQERYPGIRGIGFSAQVQPVQKATVVAQMRQQGFDSFTIQPDFPRDIYHTILYLEPLDRRNQAAIGFDMFTQPIRRAAMEKARDTGTPTASGRVTLVQEIDQHKQAGFLIYVPVYRQGAVPTTVEQRRATLQGFIYSPFRTDDLFRGIFGSEKYPLVDFQIYDGTQIKPDNLLHQSNRKNRSLDRTPRFRTRTVLEIAGRPWTIVFTSRSELDEFSRSHWVPYIGVGGIVISLVLFGVTRSQALAQQRAEQAASDLRQSQAALRESELRLRRLVDANIIGIIISDTNGLIVETNDAFLKIVGYSRAEVISGEVSWHDMTPPDYRYLDERAMREMTSQGSHAPYEKEFIRKDGTRIPVLVGTAYLGGPGDLGVSFLLDLTEQKKTEQALRQSEERFQLFMNNSPTASWITDAEGEVVYLSDTYYRMFQLSLENAVGRHIFELYPSEFAEQYLHNIRRVAETQQVIETAESGPRLDGTVGEFLVYKFPITDASARSLVGGVAIDITERNRVEAEREQLLTREQSARAEAEAANRMKDEFLATLSHELRTPLNAMMGWTQLLRTRKFDESTTARALETIDRNTKALAQLIEDLLDVSRIMTGKFRLNLHPVNLASAIQAAVEAVQATATAKQIEIQLQFPSEDLIVLGDAMRLQQVIWNLLSNAIKFTPAQGKVAVRFERDRNQACITVTDTGQGISPDFLPYIFERFRQADGTITRTHGGLGLGLAIVRHLVELHGGNIWAESPGKGQGATFTVVLPLNLNPFSKPSAFESSQSSPFIETTETVPEQSTTLKDLWILAVDDEPDARDLLVALLQAKGATVTPAASASEAFSLITQGTAQGRPDLLLSDIGMPDEDGYSLIKRIRTLTPEQGGQILAIALTAYARTEEKDRALAAGFHRHIAKPVVPTELVNSIAELVQQRC